MKPCTLIVIAAFAAATPVPAASIVWVSDMIPIGTGTTDNDGGAEGVFGGGAGPYPDQGIVDLLSGAGHTVTRFNPSNGSPLSAANVAALNTYDLVIIGRGIASGSFDSAAETLEWNTSITKPLMSTNTYMSRASRLGWFVGSTQSDRVLNALTFTNPSDEVSSYIIGSTAMAGATMVNSYTEPVIFPDAAVDVRGISIITDAPVAGATTIATATPAGAPTSQFIVSYPSGTTLTPGSGPGNNQVLGGYRMMFLVGNRESATAPNNPLGSAGFNNLTEEGEGMFLRAVTVAANNGVIPEPGTAALLLLGASSLLRRRRN